MRVELLRIERQDLVDLGARVGVAIGVEMQTGDEQVWIGELWIDRQRLRRGFGRLRRILVFEHAGDAGVRGRPVGVGLERGLERLERACRIGFLEEQPSVGGLDHRGIAAGAIRREEKRLGFARTIERVAGARRAQQHGRIRGRSALLVDRGEDRLRVAAAADRAIEQRELERGLARRLPRGDRLEHRLRLAVLAARRGELREHDRGRRIRGAAGRRHLLRLVPLPVRDGGRRRAREIRGARRRLWPPDGRAGCSEGDEQNEYEKQPCGAEEATLHQFRPIIDHAWSAPGPFKQSLCRFRR